MASLWRCPPLKLRRPTVHPPQYILKCECIRALRTFGVKSLRHSPDELAIRLARSGLDLLACRMLATISDIRGNRPGEHNGVLEQVQLSMQHAQILAFWLTCGTTPIALRHDAGLNSRMSKGMRISGVLH